MAATKTKVGEIRVGDKVRVDWTGATYSTYVDMATWMGLGKWTRGNSPRKYTEGIVVAVKRHEKACVDVVAFLAPDGKEYMVGNDGLTVIEREKGMNNKFKIGDTLLVTDTGLSYSTYTQGAEHLGITNIWSKGRWASDHLTDDVSCVKVLSFVFDKGDYIYGVQCGKGMGWVIGEEGLELLARGEATPTRRECVDYAKGIIQMDSELQTPRNEVEELRREVETLRAFKERVMEAVE